MMKFVLLFTATQILCCILCIACSAPVVPMNAELQDPNLKPSPIENPIEIQTLSPKSGKCVFDFSTLKDRFEGGPVSDEYIADDRTYLERLRKCRVDVVAIQLLEFKRSHDDNLGIKAKTAYVLAQLGFEKERYADELIDIYPVWLERTREIEKASGFEAVKTFERDNINPETLIVLICGIIEAEQNETKIFRSSMRIMRLTDGAWSTGLFATYAKRFKKNPKLILTAISDLRDEDRSLIFNQFCMAIGTGRLIKDLKRTRSVAPRLVDEALEQINASETCRDSY